jgi:hypothetical protein
VDEQALACLFIVNDVVAGPYLAKLTYKSLCLVERLRSLDEMEVAITLHLTDAEGQGNSDWGRFIPEGQ